MYYTSKNILLNDFSLAMHVTDVEKVAQALIIECVLLYHHDNANPASQVM